MAAFSSEGNGGDGVHDEARCVRASRAEGGRMDGNAEAMIAGHAPPAATRRGTNDANELGMQRAASVGWGS